MIKNEMAAQGLDEPAGGKETARSQPAGIPAAPFMPHPMDEFFDDGLAHACAHPWAAAD